MDLKRLPALAALVLLLSCTDGNGRHTAADLIPQPCETVYGKGTFVLDKDAFLEVPDADSLAFSASLLRETVASSGRFNLEKKGRGGRISLACRPEAGTGAEGYRLEITPEGVDLAAETSAGLFYGVQTLRQLLGQPEFFREDRWEIPAMTITDRPSFPYRGLHLDVSRHFFPKEFVMKCLDRMAAYKLNRFHWHLTDAGGWRIEIRKYPGLTSRAAWRSCSDYMKWWKGDRHYASAGEPGAYGGYYTQEDIREIVAYAAERHITVIPEIEMPGHSEEVTAVYPELGCYGKPYRNGEFCIGNEETFRFISGVLEEVMELFPSRYIHVGGDEASTAAWKQCSRCRRRMKEEGLETERQLQSYLIRRVEKFLHAHGRRLVGWDEILEGGIAPEATVMSWRGEKGGIEAARMGHDVIMTPGSHCYFDSYQADPATQPAAIGGFLPYLKVYDYHPVPEELTAAESGHILGAQANVWTEYIPTASHAEYMIFPRLLSLAEVVWTPKEKKDPEDFKRRVAAHIGRLHREGVNAFGLSDRLDLHTVVDTAGKRLELSLESEKYRPEIRYTVDGGVEQVYRGPFHITDSARIRAYILHDGKPSSEVLDARADYHRGIGCKVSYGRMYSPSYPAAGTATLTDGYRGGLTYGDGRWQGFLCDVDVVVDLDSVRDLSYVSGRFMQLTGPGVYMPRYVVVSVSDDGKDFREVARMENSVPASEDKLVIRDFAADIRARGRYLKFFARRQHGFQFLDEIIIY